MSLGVSGNLLPFCLETASDDVVMLVKRRCGGWCSVSCGATPSFEGTHLSIHVLAFHSMCIQMIARPSMRASWHYSVPNVIL